LVQPSYFVRHAFSQAIPALVNAPPLSVITSKQGSMRWSHAAEHSGQSSPSGHPTAFAFPIAHSSPCEAATPSRKQGS